MDNDKLTLLQLWRDHKWLIILALAAFVFAVSVISYGFFKTIFLFACVAAGIYAGYRLDLRKKKDKSEDDFYNGR